MVSAELNLEIRTEREGRNLGTGKIQGTCQSDLITAEEDQFDFMIASSADKGEQCLMEMAVKILYFK